MTDTTRTPNDIARAEYSARVWEQMQRDEIAELKEWLVRERSTAAQYKEMWRRDSAERTIAEWECARLRERVAAQRAELTHEIRVAIEHQADIEISELREQLATVTAERVTGVVVDDAMVEAVYEALGRKCGFVSCDEYARPFPNGHTHIDNVEIEDVRTALAALSTATLVPLASARPEGHHTHAVEGTVVSEVPFYRGLAQPSTPEPK